MGRRNEEAKASAAVYILWHRDWEEEGLGSSIEEMLRGREAVAGHPPGAEEIGRWVVMGATVLWKPPKFWVIWVMQIPARLYKSSPSLEEKFWHLLNHLRKLAMVVKKSPQSVFLLKLNVKLPSRSAHTYTWGLGGNAVQIRGNKLSRHLHLINCSETSPKILSWVIAPFLSVYVWAIYFFNGMLKAHLKMKLWH